MRMPSGVVDQYIYFVAVDATDYVTRETGLATFTVYRSRNGAAAAIFLTPTINETDVTNMPGVYELLLDEDMTIDAGDQSQEIAYHITHAGMAPVTRVIELYRPDVTAGETLTVASGVTRANDSAGAALATAAALTTVDDFLDTEIAAILADTDEIQISLAAGGLIESMVDDLQAEVDGIQADTEDIQARLPAALVGGRIDANVGAISSDATAADNAEAFFDGTGYAGTGNTIPTVTTVTTTTTATNVTTVNGLAANVITAASMAADASAEIADAVWDEDATAHQTLGTFGQAIGDPVADTNTIYKAVVTDATGATVGVDVAAILVDTAEIGVAGAGLTAADDAVMTRLGAPAGASISADILVIDNFVDDIESRIGTPTDLGGGATIAFNLSDIEAQTDDIGALGAGLTAIPWNAAWDPEVQSEVDDALNTALSELGVAAPTATPTVRTAIMLLYMALRNRRQTTATADTIQNDAGATIATATLSDDATTFTKGEYA